jgi:hypothetical protein
MAISTIKNPNPTQDDMKNANYRYKKDSYIINPAIHVNEQWLPIQLCNVQDWYYISSYGRVYSKLYDCMVRSRYIGRGYLAVTLRTKDNKAVDYLIHRLVMIHFQPIENPDEFQVNHIDTNKITNTTYNLEWSTNSENMIHAYKHNLYKNGEDNNFAVISNLQAKKICEALEMGYGYDDICNYADLPITKRSKSLICQIKIRHNWKHISKDYNF